MPQYKIYLAAVKMNGRRSKSIVFPGLGDCSFIQDDRTYIETIIYNDLIQQKNLLMIKNEN